MAMARDRDDSRHDQGDHLSIRQAFPVLQVVGVIVLLAVITAGAAPVDAQQSTANTTAVSGPSNGGEGTTVVAQVDGDVRVLDYSYSESREVMSVEIENTGSTSSTVTITEAISADQTGAGTFGIEVVEVDDGETVTVEVSVASTGGSAGVMITTETSVEQGTGTYLQVDLGGASLFDGSAGWGEVRAGVFSTLLFCLGVVVLAGWHVVASRHETVQEVDVDG